MKEIFLNLLVFLTLLMSTFSITSKNPVISILFLIFVTNKKLDFTVTNSKLCSLDTGYRFFSILDCRK